MNYFYVLNHYIKWRFTIQFIQFILLLFYTDLISYTWISTDIVAVRQNLLFANLTYFFMIDFTGHPSPLYILKANECIQRESPIGLLSNDTLGSMGSQQPHVLLSFEICCIFNNYELE